MLTAMGDVMREAYKRGWITTRDGNVSVRRGNCLYVTPSAIRKYTTQVEQLKKMKVRWGETHADELSHKGASIELDMHFFIHDDRGKLGSVVHLHPTYTVAAMHAGFDLSKLVDSFPELGRYTKVGKNVQAFYPGTEGLARTTAINIKGNDIVGQIGHGVTAWGENPWDAFEHIERLEHICQIVLASGVHLGGKKKA